jgi:hypothetical protein
MVLYQFNGELLQLVMYGLGGFSGALWAYLLASA